MTNVDKGYGLTKEGLSAPKEYLKAPREFILELTNGCGPKGWKIDLVPDNILGVDITEACRIHDFMYEMGLTLVDKNFADELFKNNMMTLVVRESNALTLTVRKFMVERYYNAVNSFGMDAFLDKDVHEN